MTSLMWAIRKNNVTAGIKSCGDDDFALSLLTCFRYMHIKIIFTTEDDTHQTPATVALQLFNVICYCNPHIISFNVSNSFWIRFSTGGECMVLDSNDPT